MVAFPLPAGISNSKWAGELPQIWFFGGSWKVSNLSSVYLKHKSSWNVYLWTREVIKKGLHLSFSFFFFSWELITWLCYSYCNLSVMLNLEDVLAAVLVIFSCWHHQICYLYHLPVLKAHQVYVFFFDCFSFVLLHLKKWVCFLWCHFSIFDKLILKIKAVWNLTLKPPYFHQEQNKINKQKTPPTPKQHYPLQIVLEHCGWGRTVAGMILIFYFGHKS